MMSPMGVLTTVASLLAVVSAAPSKHVSQMTARANQAITAPIAAAWMYLSDDSDYETIPSEWSNIKFDVVDVLYLGPAGVQSDGTFGLYKSDKDGDLSKRFNWVVYEARLQNPNIKVIVSQWWNGSKDGNWGQGLDALDSNGVDAYASSVANFMTTYGINGYDIDYESNNVQTLTVDVIAKVKSQLNGLSDAPFYLTVSPATTQYLDQAYSNIDFVNMQTYAGGSGLTPDDFTGLGFTSKQLLYGICPESGCSGPSTSDAEAAYKQYNLAGVHTYRLNSDNYEHEDEVAADIYTALHS